MRIDPYTGGREMHAGLDVSAPIGTPVVAPADGVVVFAGVRGGYGLSLVLDHSMGLMSHYGHLQSVSVQLGDLIVRGAPVAMLGNSGRSTGPHLHYEVRFNGIPENPRRYILE